MIKVLIVDDNPQNLYMLQVLLKGNGYEVDTATNGAEALEKARRDPPDLIIADILMPVMDGFTLCREWKKDEVLKSIPFVFYTATYTDPRDEELALDLGAERFIVKPVEPDIFVEMLREVIREAEEGRLVAPREPVEEEAVFLSEYNEALIRKLEHKMLQLEEANQAMGAEIVERKRAEEALRERVKELTCLYAVSRDMQEDLSVDGLCRRAVEHLVPAMQFPEITVPVIQLDGKRFTSERYTEGLSHGLHAEIGVRGEARGQMWVYYAEERPFIIPEEQNLVNGVAEVLSMWLEHERAQEALRESEERFALAVQGSNAGIWDWDIQENSLYWSPRLKELLGYADDELDVDYDTFESRLHPDDREHTAAAIEAHLKDRGLYEVEQRLRTKSGEYRWFLSRGQALWDEAGNPIRMVGSTTNITERKQAEEQVHNLATKLKAIARPSRQMSALLDPDELILQVVQSLQGISGCYNANLFLREDDELVFAAGQGGYVDGRQPVGYRLPLGQGIIGHVAQSGQPLLISDVSQDSRYVAWEGLPHTRSELAVPVKRGDRVLGVVDMQSTELNAFDAADLEALGVLADQLAIALQNAQLFEETRRRLEYLQALRNVDVAITSSLDLRVTLDVLLDQVTTQLQVDAADVLLFNPHTLTLEYTTGRGFHTAALRHTRLRLGDGLAGRAAFKRRIVNIADLREAKDAFQRASLLDGEKFAAYFGVPLIAKGKIKGVLEVFHRVPLDPSQEWVGFLEALATQAAIAVDNAELFEGLQRSNIELTQAYDTTIEGWSRAMDLRDHETEGHSERVANLTVRIARALGMDDEQLVHVRRGALLHDIGKMGIPDSILLKPGKLTDEEWEIMRQHPAYAHDFLSPIGYLRPALDIPHCHHEKWDGTGYPRGLKGEQIPLAARIFAVVDVWDALCSDRPYRDAWPEEKAIEHIREQAGKHFDPQVVKVFLELVVKDAGTS